MATPTTVSCPPPVNSAAPAPTSSAVAPGAPTPPPPPRLQYVGVRRLPGGGGWAAHVLVDPERRAYRTVGPFPDEHAAALAHDRVAMAYLGDRGRANFRPAFNQMEQRFLRLCRTREGEIDLCALVADAATYEARYAAFLRAVLALPRWGEYLGAVVEFFIGRAREIGEDALKDESGEMVADRFVEMHRNKARDPRWRASYVDFLTKRMETLERERLRRQQQQREGAGCAGAGAVQPPPQQQQQ
ncbi:unnamed protein product [Urochloa humidicola]